MSCLIDVVLSASIAACSPGWDTTIGEIGPSTGYVGAFATWQGEIYAGGSFEDCGNAHAALLSIWNPDTNTWRRAGGGLDRGNTNGFVASITTHDVGSGEMVYVGGLFRDAANVEDTQSIAAWDGNEWHSLGAGLVQGQAVWAIQPGDLGDGTRLYIGGGFDTIGGVGANRIAAFDDEGFHVLGNGIGVEGSFSPFVSDIEVFDDGSGPALYIVGRFDAVDGVNASLVARFRDGAWERVGAGLIQSSATTTLDALLVHDDGTGPAIYLCGSSFRIAGVGGLHSVARWDGTAWEGVGQDVGGRVTDMAAFDDGEGVDLYISGTATPDIAYFASLQDGTWSPVDGGVGGPPVSPSNFPSAFALHTFDGGLLVGGNFTEVGDEGLSSVGMVIRTPCGCEADLNDDGVLNIFDVLEFLAAFDAEEGLGDWNGDTEFSIFDVLDYLEVFDAGC